MAQDLHTVRAARLHELGEPLVVEEVELPEPAPDEVRVDLEYGGVNPVDRYVAEGRVNPGGARPRTLGGEAAGRLDGTPVMVAGEGLGSARNGVWAQAAVVPRGAVIELPAGVETREAAAMGVTGLTALKVVRDIGRVTSDDRVLVLGASGGVGGVIVSLAHAIGATVWGQTGSAEKTQGILDQGADRAIVAGPEDLVAEVSDLQPTVVFDPLGGPFLAPAVEASEVRGRIVSFGTSAGAEVTFNLQALYRKMMSLLGYGGMQLRPEERRPGLADALQALSEGSLRVRIDSVLPLEQVNEAFAALVERRVQGNLLLDLS